MRRLDFRDKISSLDISFSDQINVGVMEGISYLFYTDES